MKLLPKYLYFILFSTFPLLGLSQTAHTESILVKEPQTMLVSVFGTEWVSSNPAMVAALKDCQDNRITFKTETLTSSDKYPLLSSFPLMTKFNPNVSAANFAQFDPETFNPFTYNIEYLSDKTQVIRIDGTNWLMVVQPVKR